MSLAMHYAVKRRGMAKGGMAEGGEAKEKSTHGPNTTPGHPDPDRMRRLDQWEIDNKQGKYAPKEMAEGGEACQMCKGGSCMAHGGDVVDRIMRRMSEGGEIANGGETNEADQDPAQFDDLALRDDLESSYTGANSGDMDGAPAAAMDDHDDIVDRIMKKVRQTMPRTGQPGYPE